MKFCNNFIYEQNIPFKNKITLNNLVMQLPVTFRCYKLKVIASIEGFNLL